MKRIMIYCQHLAGMGHLVRCREIMLRLIDSFEVCFVSGGQIVPGFQLPSAVEVVQLPALRQKGKALSPLDSTRSLEEVKADRKQQLLTLFERFQPDCIITECFPFSKLTMKYELGPLLKQAKVATHPPKIVCSLRDLIMTQPLSNEARHRRAEKICRWINRFYDAVLFHSDPHFQTIEETFPAAGNIACDIFYTGYVAQAPRVSYGGHSSVLTSEDIVGLSDKSPTMVASVGGGRHGYSLLAAVIEASPLLAQWFPHHIYAFAGPFMPEADFLKLKAAAAHQPNVTLRRYTTHLLDYLKKADLSISLGGYNTTMNLLRTGVRSLILPSPNPSQTDEQSIRAKKLSMLGILEMLTPEALAPEPLMASITASLQKPPNHYPINLKGAQGTAQYIRKLLSQPIKTNQPPNLCQRETTQKKTSRRKTSQKEASTTQKAAAPSAQYKHIASKNVVHHPV